MKETPVKQFFNRKTKKWHVYFRNPETGDVRIKQVNDRKMEGVKVIGKFRPDGNEIAKKLYTTPENKNDSEWISTKEKFPESNVKIKMVDDLGKKFEGFYDKDRAGYFNFDDKEIIGVVKWKPIFTLKKEKIKNESGPKRENESESDDNSEDYFNFL